MNLYEGALEKWGIDSQLGMTQEECAELIKAINKWHRGIATDTELIEECIDVELMINQMREYFKNDMVTWERIKAEKLARLEFLLK